MPEAGGKRALILFSGGLDSTTTLAIARSRGFEPLALIFRYGQRHAIEVETAQRSANRLGVPARIETLDLRAAGGSALTSDTLVVPRNREPREIAEGGIPSTYVPARNTIFLAHALAWAEVEAIDDIFLGVNAVDYSGYPDCRPEYLEAFERLANLASKRATQDGKELRIHAPLLHWSKAEIIRQGVALGVDYSATWSCYAPIERQGEWLACGECDSCHLRRKGFLEAEVPDPTVYVSGDDR